MPSAACDTVSICLRTCVLLASNLLTHLGRREEHALKRHREVVRGARPLDEDLVVVVGRAVGRGPVPRLDARLVRGSGLRARSSRLEIRGF